MKKLSVVIAALCFVFASCGEKKPAASTETPTTATECQHKHDKDKCPGMTEEQKKECEEFQKKWDNWANLTDVEKKELIDKKKTFVEEKKVKMEEMEAKMKAEKAEFEAQWAKWDQLTLDEQKALLDKATSCKGKKCCGKKEDCKK